MDVISNINNNLNTYNENCNLSTQGSAEINTVNTITDETNNLGGKSDYSKKELDDALKKINNFLKDEKTHAEYSVHKDFGTIMIKIVDEDDKVIMEIPPEKILDMIASMCKQFGLLDKKA